MNSNPALAHISENKARAQTVYEHLSGTADLAGEFAAPFGATEEARFAGWLHDIGKYSTAFQKRLLEDGPRVDHATAGAQEAMHCRPPHPQAAFAVAGHHTGLPDGGNQRNADPEDGTLFGRLKKPVEPYGGWQEVPLPQSAPPAWANRDLLDFAFFTRMLYSCLVDADFLDTETFMNGRAAQGMKRVIYVIPYMSIIDQTAANFTKLLGEENVLADYSSAEYKTTNTEDLTPAQYRQLLASENWDAPVIVTTAVQFFELLYANRSSRCRKLHNIADSVIIFDEAQTLPLDSLKPCISAIAQLVQHYHATAVLCTATQPALESLFKEFAPELRMQEISPDTETLYETLRRTTIRDIGTLPQEELAAQLAALPQVLCVVNRRKTAQELYAALPEEGSFCLTTLLCAADRRRQLEEIRQRLADGLPCRVVSTSLIEAGVDVDFPAAYREQCGLDSLLQTAGRCNREGRRSAAESKVYCFRLEGCAVPQMLHQHVHALQYAARCHENDYAQLNTPDAIRTYFQELYFARGAEALDKKGILDAFRHGISGCQFPFAQVAAEFQLIETPTRTVYLPIGEGEVLCAQLRSGMVSRSLYRRLGTYSVACYAPQFEKLDAAGALELLPEGSAILTDLNQYSAKTGLALDAETGIGLFF